MIHLNYPADTEQSDAQVEAEVRAALGIGEHPMAIHKITRWRMEAVLAASFQVRRVFLIGDAAHRHPPTGGLGLTSAIQDAQNICWKLAAVLAGDASTRLLETYGPERRPVDQRNCQRSLENGLNHFQVAAAIGIAPENSPEQNMALLRRVLSREPKDAEHCSTVLRQLRAQSMEFSELNVEYGYVYESAAVVGDDTRPRTRPMTSASTSPRRVPEHLCRTPGSTTERRAPRAQGPRRARAVPSDRGRGRPGVVRGGPSPVR